MSQNHEVEMLSRQMAQGFSHLSSRLDDVVTRLDRVNGSVADAQLKIARTDTRVDNLEGDIAQLSDQTEKTQRGASGRNRRVTMWDVGVFVAGATALLWLLKVLGLIKVAVP